MLVESQRDSRKLLPLSVIGGRYKVIERIRMRFLIEPERRLRIENGMSFVLAVDKSPLLSQLHPVLSHYTITTYLKISAFRFLTTVNSVRSCLNEP